MSVKHLITRNIGNLRGFSTDSIFLRPPNVADTAINLQKGPDNTIQIRRGYQCQIANIGGMGIETFNDPLSDSIETVTINTDGFLYKKLQKQIYFDYDGRVKGNITNISNGNPAQVTSANHGLQTGAQVIIRDVLGMVNINNTTYTITVVDANNFTLNGIDSTSYPAYISGGYWSIAFADNRYLTATIFTDPRYLVTNPGWSVQPWSVSPWGAPSGESITANITVNRAAQITANATNTNTATVAFGHELVATDTIQFYDANGVFNQRAVVSVTDTSVTFDGYAISLTNGTYINQFYDILFRTGFDLISPFTIQDFIDVLTDPTTGIYGLLISVNGDTNYPAAFLQIFEPIIIDSPQLFTLNYWYWQKVNYTISPPFPGSANVTYQNSPEFENASIIAFEDVVYLANGWDYPQKYDGQTVYRTGMPQGDRPSAVDDTTSTIKPFNQNEVYEYAITYQQVDNRGHIVEGEISEVWSHTIAAATASMDVTVTNLVSSVANNWNTNGAIAIGGTASVYGPDSEGFYYDLVSVSAGYTLKIGDSAYYFDETCAVVNGAQANVVTINVDAGHNVLPLDIVYFQTTTPALVQRLVTEVTATSITISGSPVTVADNENIGVYLANKVFGDVGIVNGAQSNINTITIDAGHTLRLNDEVEFIDSNNNLQRRNVTATGATSVTIDGNPVSVNDNVLITSTNQRQDAITLKRTNSAGATLLANAPISNNLRINIYRTEKNKSFSVTGELFLVASIPNDSISSATQTYNDLLADAELGREFGNPVQQPNPPPISKYLKSFGNQIFYAGGERGNSENSDNVFFSQGGLPESVALATDFFSVPNVDDDVTGIGVSGTTLVVTKNQSLWAATGNFLTGQINVVQIAPGTNIGCVAHATIASVGTLMYFLHTNGVYAITENQLYPTDPFGNPIPLSISIDALFRTIPYLPRARYQYKRAVGFNYTKDNQYLLFLPCEDANSTIRTANSLSTVLCYDYQGKNWFQWYNINAAGGMFVIDDDLYFQSRQASSSNGNTANLYKQHRFYRLIDHADHASPQSVEWKSSWEDMGQPEVRKKFCRCILLMDRFSELYQYNNPQMVFSSYLNRIPNLQNTIVDITQVDNIRNAGWSVTPWGWNFWSGYQDSFITVNLRQGTVAKSIQVGFTIQGINMDIKLAGFQIEIIPENRKTVVR